MPPIPRAAAADDWWTAQSQKLIDDGWIFSEVSRYDPTRLRGFTPFVLPSGIANTPTNRRRLNRPFWAQVNSDGVDPTLPWSGNLRFAAVSVLQPWIDGSTAPFGLDSQVNRVGTTGHYLSDVDWTPNPIVQQEEDAARDAPVNQITKSYSNMWIMDPNFPTDWRKGASDSLAMYNALRDLFISIVV